MNSTANAGKRVTGDSEMTTRRRGRPLKEYSLVHCSMSLIAQLERTLIKQYGENWAAEMAEWETPAGSLNSNALELKRWIARTRIAIENELAKEDAG